MVWTTRHSIHHSTGIVDGDCLLPMREVGCNSPNTRAARRTAGPPSCTRRSSPLAGVAAGVPGSRPRDWPGALALGLFRLRRRLGGGRGLLLDEDVLRGGSFEQSGELLGVDRLPLEQDLGDVVELVVLVGEQVLGSLVGGLDDAADLIVDLTGDLVGVIGLRGE